MGREEGPIVTEREEVPGGTEITPMEIEHVFHQVVQEQSVHPYDLGQSASSLHTPPIDPSAVYPSIHSTGTEFLSCSAPLESILAQLTPPADPQGHSYSLQHTPLDDPRGQSSFSQCTHPVDPGALGWSPLPLQRQERVLIPCNLGRTHWVIAIVDLTTGNIYLMDLFRQQVPFRHRNEQLACLRGNCGAHTFRLEEYLTGNRDIFEWSKDDMGTIREKMAVEDYCNSKHWFSS
ncbi:hypothetical protein LWI28_001823 [Acer negundo]|uniref:Ubiquitin-like protease family profile domain-containing protein n=1 Tax=Acer negundo TaxID=4023 RepID=A0AAD5P565_ACENE|nr:hypothetical protein LWI28_001823 [Acer negundo]